MTSYNFAEKRASLTWLKPFSPAQKTTFPIPVAGADNMTMLSTNVGNVSRARNTNAINYKSNERCAMPIK